MEYYSSLFSTLDCDDDGRVGFRDAFPVLIRSGVSRVSSEGTCRESGLILYIINITYNTIVLGCLL
jgi:hypothetical protein